MRVLALPPPNVTGRLHVGHALTGAVSEAWLRRRSQGLPPSQRPLWLPGFDHAGIATQIQVTQHLVDQGIDPSTLSRRQLLKHALKWKDQRVDEITSQLKELRFPLAWDKSFYTMEKSFSRAVREAFIRLHKDGRIRRSRRPVLWSPHLQSTLSNREVEAVDVPEPRTFTLPSGEEIEAGWLYTVHYPIAGTSETVAVATTRPETIPADVAVAVHPGDERFASLLSSKAQLRHPLHPDRLIPIIPDAEVKPDVGTGALKITPAHSVVDWEIGHRHGLAESSESCVEWDGSLGWGEGREGRARGSGRAIVLAELERRGLLKDRRPFPTTVPVCRRSGDVVETMVKAQWVMDIKGLVTEKDLSSLRLQPKSSIHVLRSWLLEGEDWLLSRQLWWGHQIPAWNTSSSNDEREASWVVSERSPSPDAVQDPDVLDTWFSSALVPLVLGGWPKNPSPRQLEGLISGHDILGFWIARMVLMSKALTGQMPFPEVLVHSLVTDGGSVKMSKSKGNVVDPIQLVREPPSRAKTRDETKPEGRGADWLKFSLLSLDTSARFVSFNPIAAEENLNLIFKLRNSLVFWRQSAWLPGWETPNCSPKDGRFEMWLRRRLRRTIHMASRAFNTNQLREAPAWLSRFYWEDFCDVYLEAVKPELRNGDAERKASIASLAALTSNLLLRSLHPLLPDTTAELWTQYPEIRLGQPSDILAAPPPSPKEVIDDSSNSEEDFSKDSVDSELLLLKGVWGLRTSMGLAKKGPARILLKEGTLLGGAEGDWDSGLGRIAVTKASDEVQTKWLAEGAVPIHIPLSGQESEIVLVGMEETVNSLDRLETQLITRSRDLKRLEEKLGKLESASAKRRASVKRPSQMAQVEKMEQTLDKVRRDVQNRKVQVSTIRETLSLALNLQSSKPQQETG